MPPQFFRMLWAELRTVFQRRTGIAVLAVALLVPIAVLGAIALIKARTVGLTVQNMPADQLLQFTAAEAAGWALRGRNFYVLPLFLLLATGEAFAAEREEHTLRELLVRPVPRWSVLAVKFLALVALSLASLALSLAPSLVGGFAISQDAGPIVDLLLGYLASAASDAGLIALGLLAGTFVRGAGGVVVSVIALLMVDMGARGLLWIMGKVQVTWAEQVGGLLPGASLAAWEGWKDGWAWQPFVGLAVLLGLCLSATLLRLQRADVP